MDLGCVSGIKSKVGLPRVTMELDKSLNHSPQGGLEKIGYTSSNGPPEKLLQSIEQILNRTCTRKTKSRVYNILKKIWYLVFQSSFRGGERPLITS